METYAIAVKETLSNTFLIRADNLDEAIDSIKKSYDAGEIVFDYDDSAGCSIEASPNWEGGIFKGSEEIRALYKEF